MRTTTSTTTNTTTKTTFVKFTMTATMTTTTPFTTITTATTTMTTTVLTICHVIDAASNVVACIFQWIALFHVANKNDLSGGQFINDRFDFLFFDCKSGGLKGRGKGGGGHIVESKINGGTTE